MKLKFVIATLIAVAIIAAFGTSYFYTNYKILGKQVIPIDLEVGQIIGITTDNDALHMGRIPPGKGAMRQLNITNNYDFKVKLYAKVESNDGIEDWISSKINGAILESGENEIFWFNMNVPEEAEEKNYKGNFTIIFLRV